MFEQAVLAVQDKETFADLHKALEAAFARQSVEVFLSEVRKQKLRARQFESILASGLLGREAPAKYAALGDSDRGQIREQYLRMVEQVDPAVRSKFLKVYAYY
jgi:hypothetical protein